MTPRATIAILNWNGGDFVGSCIESILGQSEQDIEVVVVDNGSSDGSADAIERILAASTVHHQVVRLPENLGICGGLQVALDRAAGEYFFPFASDDEMQPDRVERQCDQLDAAGSATHIAAGAVALIGTDGAPLRSWTRRPLTLDPPRYGGKQPADTLTFSLAVPPAPGLAFRTAGLRSIGGYDPAAPVEDVDTFTRLVLLGGSGVVTTREVVSLYRRHGSNASRRGDLMGQGLEHTLRTLVDSGVDFGPVRDRWLYYLDARSQGYTSPWGRLMRTIGTEPLDRSDVRSAGIAVIRSGMSTRRRVRAGVAVVAPALAARRYRRLNG